MATSQNTLFFLFGLLLWLAAISDGKLICFDCSHLTDPDGCKTFSDCKDGEQCYREVVETDNGTAEFDWGCASDQLCTLESSIGGRKRVSVERCFECCGDSFCNFGACTKDYCSTVKCLNGATCQNLALKGDCLCTNGYTGRYCETDINECASNPCQNGGSCTDEIGRFRCTCLPGFAGVLCEINIDECAPSPCQNGATCNDGINMYSCTCVPGYTGLVCDTDIDECLQGKCQYDSTCVDKVNDYECVCPAGITGRDCEIDIDDCAPVTCQNNGTCVDHINSFSCQCSLGFAGTYCETSLGRVCYECSDVDTVESCTQQTICGKNEECYMEHELVDTGDFNFNLGCVPVGMCNVIQSADGGGGITHLGRNIRPIQLCYECCDQNGCNHHACQDTRGNGN